MKTLKAFIVLIVALSSTSCKKDKITGSDLTTTITYNSNIPDIGAKVYLFLLPEKPYVPGAIDTDSDWITNYAGELNNQYSEYSGTINSEGRVTFANVPYGHYALAVYPHKVPAYLIKLIMVAEEDKNVTYNYYTN